MASSKVNPSRTASAKVHNGLLPTPPMPEGLPQANLTDNARKVLMKRYVRRGDDGKPAETVEEMFWRVAYHVAKVEEQWEADVCRSAPLSITIYYPARNFSRTHRPLPAPAPRWVSWQPVSCCRSPMIWDVTRPASSRPCAMRP